MPLKLIVPHQDFSEEMHSRFCRMNLKLCLKRTVVILLIFILLFLMFYTPKKKKVQYQPKLKIPRLGEQFQFPKRNITFKTFSHRDLTQIDKKKIDFDEARAVTKLTDEQVYVYRVQALEATTFLVFVRGLREEQHLHLDFAHCKVGNVTVKLLQINVETFVCQRAEIMPENAIVTVGYTLRDLKSDVTWGSRQLILSGKPYVQLCIATLMKNEGFFIDDWILYHTRQGVRRFLIYDNNSTDDTAEILAKYKHVTRIFWPYSKTQYGAISDALMQTRGVCNRTMFIDVDEFVFPVMTDKTVKQMLFDSPKLYTSRDGKPNPTAICLQVKAMGSSNRIKRPNMTLAEAYIHVAEWYRSTRTKCAIRPDRCYYTTSVHTFPTNKSEAIVANYKLYIVHYKYQCWECWVKNKLLRERPSPRSHDPDMTKPVNLSSPGLRWTDPPGRVDVGFRDYKRKVDKWPLPPGLVINQWPQPHIQNSETAFIKNNKLETLPDVSKSLGNQRSNLQEQKERLSFLQKKYPYMNPQRTKPLKGLQNDKIQLQNQLLDISPSNAESTDLDLQNKHLVGRNVIQPQVFDFRNPAPKTYPSIHVEEVQKEHNLPTEEQSVQLNPKEVKDLAVFPFHGQSSGSETRGFEQLNNQKEDFEQAEQLDIQEENEKPDGSQPVQEQTNNIQDQLSDTRNLDETSLRVAPLQNNEFNDQDIESQGVKTQNVDTREIPSQFKLLKSNKEIQAEHNLPVEEQSVQLDQNKAQDLDTYPFKERSLDFRPDMQQDAMKQQENQDYKGPS